MSLTGCRNFPAVLLTRVATVAPLPNLPARNTGQLYCSGHDKRGLVPRSHAKLKVRFEDRTMTDPKDEGILSDLRSLRVVRGVARVPETRSKDV